MLLVILLALLLQVVASLREAGSIACRFRDFCDIL